MNKALQIVPEIIATPHFYANQFYPVTDKTLAYMEEATAARSALIEPVVGDLVRLPDCTLDRITHIWDRDKDKMEYEWQGLYFWDKVLDAESAANTGSFYLDQGGHASYSGALSNARKDRLSRHSIKLAKFWFPESGWLRAGCAVTAKIPTTVWEV